MRLLISLRIATIAATAALLGASAQAAPVLTNVAVMKSMVDQSTTEVRWGGGWRGGGFRGRGWGYRGGFGYRGWGYRGAGYGVAAGAIVGGAVARRAYYGGYGGYSGGYGNDGYAAEPHYGYGGDPSYSYVAEPHYGGYGYGDVSYSGGCTCPPYGGYVAVHQYGW